MAIKYTDEELIHILKRYAKQLGRTPTTCDLDVMGGPRRQAYYRHFGRTWAEVLEAAGLPPVERASIHEKYIHRDTPTIEQVVDAFTSFIDEYGYMPPKIDYSDFYRESRKLFKSPVETNICQAVQKSMPGSKYSCEFIRKYMKGEYDE